MYNWQVIDVSAYVYPVTLAEVKNYCQIDSDYTYDDDQLTLLMKASVAKLEQHTGLAFSLKTIQFTANEQVEYPITPVVNVVSVVDNDNVPLDVFYPQGLIYPVISFKQRPFPTYTVVYKAGYHDTDIINGSLTYKANPLPDAIRAAILLLTRAYYDRAKLEASGDEKNAKVGNLDTTALLLVNEFKANPLF